jgi:hypothetical protein
MKLLLDEMWTPAIAQELRRRGFDVVAINEREQAARYAGVPDDVVFARAQHDGRTIVTDNISDFELARRSWESSGHVHEGIINALNPPFNRHRGKALVGAMVRALEYFLRSPAAQPRPFNRVHYLQRAPGK